MDTTIINVRNIDAALWHRLRVMAVEQHVTVAELVNDAIRRLVEHTQTSAEIEAYNAGVRAGRGLK